MALSATTIATGIANLSVSGVTILALSKVPADASRVTLPAFFPDPEAWGGEMSMTGDAGVGVQTFGTPTTRYWECIRTLGYLYLHAPAGSGRNGFEYFVSMSDNRDLIVEALAEMDVAGVDVVNIASTPFTVIDDPAGNPYFGYRMSVTVRERINA